MQGSSMWREEEPFSTAVSTEGCEENSWKLKKEQGRHESNFLPSLLLEQQGSLL